MVTYPGRYTATCESIDGRRGSRSRSCQVATLSRCAGEPRAELRLHDFDVNLALGNLVGDVQSEEAAYSGRP